MDTWGEAGQLDRCEPQRLDADWLVAQWADPAALLLSVDKSGQLNVGDDLAIVERRPAGEFDPQQHYLLGLSAGRPVFVEAADVEKGAGLRELMPVLGPADRELVVAAVALVQWHRTLPHCGLCGAATIVTNGGMVRHCPSCGRDRFPRSDPAIIVAVLDADDRLLLGHQGVWAPGRMSILAGFVTAGESLEQAVHREVGEETGLRLSAVKYVASQPWPFPRSLMLGFVARAATTDIQVDGVEIESARWFTREELTAAVDAGEVGLPGEASIAHRLIADWRAGHIHGPGDLTAR
ncbi:NAD(+) diphosphatase [Micropruina sp.]|uniref:NAD(+) diphosphatase n=1 Tax=Micropruina sp. TaxID=2737536 RepID=UPI002625D759|nr:NAD(+) diphosphatase [Micropruina sp.]